MPISQTQRTERRNAIGSSDIAAILGLSKWASAWDIWAEKTGRIEGHPENEAMRAGTVFEGGVLDYAESELGPLMRNVHRAKPDLHLAANIDAVVEGSGLPVEAKTAGLFGPLTEPWGDEGTDLVPPVYVVQAHVHMICSDRDLCHLAAFIGGRGFAMFRIRRDEAVADYIVKAASTFWEKHVIADVPPEHSLPSFEVLKRIRRKPKHIVAVDPESVAAWREAAANADAATKHADSLKAKIIAQLTIPGEPLAAEAGDFGDPHKIITYYTQTQRRVDTDMLRAAGLFDKFSRDITFPKFVLAKRPKE